LSSKHQNPQESFQHDTSKYISSDEESDDVDYSVFNGLDRSKVDKINELIDALNEEDRLLEKQEDLLDEEHDKVLEVEKFLALEVKKNKRLVCDYFHVMLLFLASINARIEKLNASSSRSSLEHVLICFKYKDHGFDACINHASTIGKLNDEIVQLNVQLKTCKNEEEF
jgi:hypothetical protein